jgi:hypothetical protein
MYSFLCLLMITLIVVIQTVPQNMSHPPAKGASFPRVQLNDNHEAAGHQHDHVLELSLIADTGMWYPAGDNEPGNMGSLAGKDGLPNLAAYSAASAGVIAFTKALSREVCDTDIRPKPATDGGSLV